ncbi:MAG: histidinol dehydrogenase [Pyrinomonas methylaliphatogenes]|nr:histidinol dehydrogenase [Pyrinomonas methylaliphatogenes]
MIELIGADEKQRRRARLERIAGRNVALDADLMREVAAIIENVKRRGDEALIEYTARFDGVELTCDGLRVSEDDLHRAAARLEREVRDVMREAARRIRAFHERQRERSWEMRSNGTRLGQRVRPIERAGLYVPGGTASYPSSVLMNVIPAQVAGVERIVVATPPQTLAENPAVAAALVELGVSEVYKVGGAQAIAALAYGTRTVPRVDKITGPGNKYVAAAKRLVFGVVGIDSIAGPSEVAIIADETADARSVAADLLAQAEHDEEAAVVLVTTRGDLADAVRREIEIQLETLPRRAIVEASLRNYGALIVVGDMDEACAVVNELAPEHLEIIARDAEAIADKIKHAGAIFLGAYTPEVVGDYFAGPNHVLPTGGAARFSSALGVYDFTRRASMLRYSREELERTARMIAVFARAEGLEAHARSALIRLDQQATQDVSATMDDGLRVALKRIKPRVRELRAYTLRSERAPIKVNQNENPFDAPERIKREALRRFERRAWSRYPDFVPVELRRKLAAFAGWDEEGIIVGNGSNELIQATMMVTLGEGRRALLSEPTFALYRQIATVLGADVLSVPLTERLTFDVAALRRAIEREDPDLTIICSPNNPTGGVIEEDDLVRLLEKASGLIVVDEAYFEFAERSAANLLRAHPNLIVFRTFSKAMAMAGWRVGYALAAPEIAREIGKAVLPYNLNAFSQIAAEVALEMYDAELLPLVQALIRERERLFEALQEISGLSPVPSKANFILVRSRIEPRRVYDELLRRGILIRDVSGYPMLADCFRVSVGRPEENDLLIEALREIFARS